MSAAGAIATGGPVQLALFGPPPAARPEPAVRTAAEDLGLAASATSAGGARSRRGGWVRRWQVESATHPGVVYVVAQRAEGAMGCSCKGWIYRASRPTCRHIAAVLAGAGIS